MSEPAPTLHCRRCGSTSHDTTLVPGSICAHDGAALVSIQVHATHPDDDLLGVLLGGKYALIDLIGRGGLGTVYRAVQHPVRRVVAVKVIRPAVGSGPEVRRRFVREARMVARLEHPSVVTLHDYGVDEARGLLYMVMELVSGQELRAVIDAEGWLPVPEASRIILQLLEAVNHAHQRDLTHRDLKPENIFITPEVEGQTGIKVLDFGLAKLGVRDGEQSTLLTHDGTVLGTPAYLAPEQARAGQIGPWTDIYAIGVIFFELLSGRRPFEGTNPFQLMTAHCNSPVPPLPEARQIPPHIEAVVQRALEKAPQDRFESVEAMAEALQRALQGSAPMDPPPDAPVWRTRAIMVLPVLFLVASAIWGLSASPDVPPEVHLTQPDVHQDAAIPDAAIPDAAIPDAAIPDAAIPDATVPDAAAADATVPDAAAADAQRPKAKARPRAIQPRRRVRTCRVALGVIQNKSSGGNMRKLCKPILRLERRVRAGRCEPGFSNARDVQMMASMCGD